MIEQDLIDKITDTAQIVDVVSEFVTLRRRGINYVGLCPFHADKSPSFYVNPTKNLCKCFACGQGGNPVSFLMKKESMTFYEAIRWLGKKYGIEVEEKKMNEEERQRQTDREGMFNVNEFAQKCFEDDLFDTPEGRNVGLTYFRERGIQDATIRRFHLGYALEDKTNLATRAIQKGHNRKYLLDGTGVGLCFGDDPKKMPICRFAGRVIFPHHSLSGKCIAFGGRILQHVDHAFKKYVNSPESPIYHKSDFPYGLFEAKNAIAKQNMCYVVEGNIDVLSMSQAGFENVIAASGTALTTEHIRVIQRFTKNCTLMFDSDTAGITAAFKSIDLLLAEGMNVRLLLLPKGEDPDSFCRKNSSEDVRKYFEENQQDFVSFKTKLMMQSINPNDPIAKARVVQDIANSIALISDPIMSSILVRQTSQMTDVSEQQVMMATNEAKKNNYLAEVHRQEIERRREEARREREELNIKEEIIEKAVTAVQQETPVQPQPVIQRTTLLSDRFERNVIRYIVRYGGQYFTFTYFDAEANENKTIDIRVIDFIYNELNSDEIVFQHPLYAKMYQLALDASEDINVQWDSIRFFSNLHSDPEVQSTALDLSQDRYDALGVAQNDEHLDVLIPRCVLELKNSILTMEIQELTEKLKHPSENMLEVMQQLKQKKEIQKIFDKELGERVIINK